MQNYCYPGPFFGPLHIAQLVLGIESKRRYWAANVDIFYFTERGSVE
jgi:hypothetical protein